MWLSLKRWPARITGLLGGPQVQQTRFGYEKTGLTVWHEPIPWNAESVLVEVPIQFPHGCDYRNDFRLELPEQALSLSAARDGMRTGEIGSLRFRLPVQKQTTQVQLYWRSLALDQVELPLLTQGRFLQNVRLRQPTVFAHVEGHHLACQTAVVGNSVGLTASGVLASPTSLLPAMDLPVTVELTDQFTSQSLSVPIRLTGSQLTAREALLSCPFPDGLLQEGLKTVQWTLAGRPLAHRVVRLICEQAFQQSLYLAGSYLLYRGPSGAVNTSCAWPPREEEGRLEPCFLLASREPGLVASCPLWLRIHYKEPERRPCVLERHVILTGSPVPCTASMFGTDDFEQVAAFELLSKEGSLGTISLYPRPVATFTSEGGFLPPDEYPWTLADEEELASHLSRLMEAPPS